MVIEPRKCLQCNTSLEGLPKQSMYCSRLCYTKMLTARYRAEVQADIKPTTCQNCGKGFKPKTRRITKFCCSLCAYDFRDKQHKVTHGDRDCTQCGEQFTPSRAFQVFCSAKCRNIVTMIKRGTGISAQEYHAAPLPMTIEERVAQDRKAVASSRGDHSTLPDGMTLPICVTCAQKQVSSIEEVNCDDCIAMMRTEGQDDSGSN